jgi:hypothetical protein
MLELEVAVKEEREVKEAVEIESLCRSLFNEWLLDLKFQEKEVWLWNSLVEMVKIKQRRTPDASNRCLYFYSKGLK